MTLLKEDEGLATDAFTQHPTYCKNVKRSFRKHIHSKSTPACLLLIPLWLLYCWWEVVIICIPIHFTELISIPKSCWYHSTPATVPFHCHRNHRDQQTGNIFIFPNRKREEQPIKATSVHLQLCRWMATPAAEDSQQVGPQNILPMLGCLWYTQEGIIA